MVSPPNQLSEQMPLHAPLNFINIIPAPQNPIYSKWAQTESPRTIRAHMMIIAAGPGADVGTAAAMLTPPRRQSPIISSSTVPNIPSPEPDWGRGFRRWSGQFGLASRASFLPAAKPQGQWEALTGSEGWRRMMGANVYGNILSTVMVGARVGINGAVMVRLSNP